MRLLSVLILASIFFTSCKKEEVTLSDSGILQTQPGWETEKFKSEYNIQFPDNYSGGYVQGIEGAWFDKVRDDARIHMLYTFNNGLQNFEFGDTLADENATSIELEQGDQLLFLDHRFDFTDEGIIVGILFHNAGQGITTGELYWKDGGVFKDALTVYYDDELREESITILATIQHH